MRALALVPLALSLAVPSAAQELENPTPTEIRLVAPPEGFHLAAPVVLPLDLDAGARPIVEVTVNGHGPYRFGIDWGASIVLVSEEVAKSAALPSIGRAAPPGMELRDVVTIESIGLGDGSIDGVAAMVGGFLDPSVDGILGFNAFEGALLTVDYPAGEVRIASGSLPAPDGREVLALEVGPDGRARPTVRIGLAGVEVDAVLDSRSPLPLMLPQSMRDRFEATGPESTARARGAQTGDMVLTLVPVAGTLRVGRFEAANPVVAFRAPPESDPEARLYAFSVVGGPFLRNFALTLDVAGGAVRFERAAEGPIELQMPRPRLVPAGR